MISGFFDSKELFLKNTSIADDYEKQVLYIVKSETSVEIDHQ
jgi:hypothetical protein